MTRRRIEFLHNSEGTSDKVYILELFQDGEMYSIVATYGKRTAPHLLKATRYQSRYAVESSRTFDKLVRDKTKKGYNRVPNGTRFEVPGFSLDLPQAVHPSTVAAPMVNRGAAGPTPQNQTKPAFRQLDI